jgi:N6-adenosine-specific RNA methylase IME4
MKYQVIYADPPWAYLWGTGKDGGHFAPEKHYKTMSTDEICALDVKSLRDKNCALFLWSTMPTLPDGLKVMDAWGFKYKTCAFAWVKTRKDGYPLAGMGSYTKSNVELCLLGMRGHIKSVDKTIPQVVMHERLGHSVKPSVVRDRIVQLFGDTVRIELFARQKANGWDAIGYGIDGISIEDRISQINNPSYVFTKIETQPKITGVKSLQTPDSLFA